jgi:hypothetical protein
MRKRIHVFQVALALAAPAGLTGRVWADPQLTSWFTSYCGKYARIYTSQAAKAAGAPAWNSSRKHRNLTTGLALWHVFGFDNEAGQIRRDRPGLTWSGFFIQSDLFQTEME